MNPSSIQTISEDDADQALTEIYADIKATLAVPAVNLVWRHLATIDGALPWVWSCIKPLYVGGYLSVPRRRLLNIPALPRFTALSTKSLQAAGIDSNQRRTVLAVLDNYARSNPGNLIALIATRQRLGAKGRLVAPPVPTPPAYIGTPRPIPPLLNPANFSPDVYRDALQLSAIGTETEATEVVAGVPRHLAHWPQLLSLFVRHLKTVDKEIATASRWVQACATQGAGPLVGLLPPAPPNIERDAIDTALQQFSAPELIANFIVKVRLLQALMGSDAALNSGTHYHAQKPDP